MTIEAKTVFCQCHKRNQVRNFDNQVKLIKYVRKTMGDAPRIDPDGYLVNPENGDCLFIGGLWAECVCLPAEGPTTPERTCQYGPCQETGSGTHNPTTRNW